MEYRNTFTKAPFDPTPYKERVEELMAKMTVAEKVGQLHLENATSTSDLTDYNLGDVTDEKNLVEKIRRGKVGTLLGRGVKEMGLAQKIAIEESRLGIPLMFGYDVIHGHKTIFPIPLGEAATWNPDILEKAEEIAAKEAYADGINWIYAPMIDLCRDPRWGRVAEGGGEDPLLGSMIAAAKVRGLQTINPETGYPYAAACFKHYCGYGLSQGGRDYEEADISPRTLFMDYMKTYDAAVQAGSMTAMSSFNVLNGEPVTASHYFLTDILRNKFGFGGFVVSDYDAVNELVHHRVAADRKEAAARAILAGVDEDMGAGAYSDYCEELYNSDPAFAEAIDTSVRRILTVKFALGLFENPYPVGNYERFTFSSEGRAIALDVARQSMVLAKNDNNTLPLSKDKKYFVTGPLSDLPNQMVGCWASYHSDSNTSTVRSAMEDAGYSIVHRVGCPYVGKFGFHELDDSDFEECARQAAECDEIIFVCGEKAVWSGENRGRIDIDLPEPQKKYLRLLKSTGKKIITVLMCGRPMSTVELHETSDAVLIAWHAGTTAGEAAVQCLSGEFNPTGRLPITFPYATGQIPYYHSWLTSGRSREQLVRYKDCTIKPLYPFGYGLSYSTITYSNERIDNPDLVNGDELSVSCTLTNESDRDAYEVVQAYFRDVVSSVATPDRKLCAFARVFVPAGGTAEVTLKIPCERFALMTTDLREIVEPGDFLIYLGHDSTATTELPFTIR